MWAGPVLVVSGTPKGHSGHPNLGGAKTGFKRFSINARRKVLSRGP